MAKSAKKRAKELAKELERELALVASSGDEAGHGSGLLPPDAALASGTPSADPESSPHERGPDGSIASDAHGVDPVSPSRSKRPEAAPSERAPSESAASKSAMPKSNSGGRRSDRKAKSAGGLAPERQSEGQATALDLPPAALSPEMGNYFAKCEEKLGFVPNVLVAYAHDAPKLSAFATFYNDLMLAPSGLSKLEREMIAVVVSAQNRCYYCLTAHGAAVRQLSGDPVLGELLVMNYRAARLAPRHRSMLDFAVKLTEASHAIEESDREALRAAGFSQRDIWDIGAVASFFNMTNRMASAVDMRPNAAYHVQAR